MLNPIEQFFSDVEDPRTGGNVRYPLNEILLVAVVTFLCGGRTYPDMVDTGKAKLKVLRGLFEFRHGIPSEDTFRYVFMLMDPRQFAGCFADWMGFLHGRVGGLVAIDGKACRGTGGGRKKSPLTIVNAYCRERGVVIGCIDTPDKTNEITVLPELLRSLDIQGCVVTLDAMGCQRKAVSQIVRQGADYLVCLKGNQGDLHKDVVEFIEAHEQTDPGFDERDFEADVYEYEEKSRGRHYRRRVVATSDFCPGLQPYRQEWEGLLTVARIQSWRTEKGETTYEVRYAIGSIAPCARRVAEAMRGHWCVENNGHWQLDVTFGEDQSKMRAMHSGKNMATVRRISMNLVSAAQKHLATKRSMKRWLRCCAMDDDALRELLRAGLRRNATGHETA